MWNGISSIVRFRNKNLVHVNQVGVLANSISRNKANLSLHLFNEVYWNITFARADMYLFEVRGNSKRRIPRKNGSD